MTVDETTLARALRAYGERIQRRPQDHEEALADAIEAATRVTDLTVHGVPLTGPQIRVLWQTLALILNDPEWGETTATSPRDMETLARAGEVLRQAWSAAARAASTPAVPR